MGTFVIGSSDSFESFLACSVPYLQFDGFTIQFECPDLEIDSNRGQERLIEYIFTEPD